MTDPMKPMKPNHARTACEYRVISLRHFFLEDVSAEFKRPENAVAYWNRHIAQQKYFNAEIENFYVLLVNVRRKPKGHHLVSTGTLDTILVHPREVFRAAILASAAAIILCHNHPSGDPTPSASDISVTRDLIRAGQLLKIDILDHIIIGRSTPQRPRSFVSLRELGWFDEKPKITRSPRKPKLRARRAAPKQWHQLRTK